MIDLRGLAAHLTGRSASRVLAENAQRVRISDCCALACPGCTVAHRYERGPHHVPALRAHRWAGRTARILLTGADPLTSRSLDKVVTEARELGVEVEVLTPGVLLTADRVNTLAMLGVGRVRIAVDNHNVIPIERIHGAGLVKGRLPVDIHLMLDGQPVSREVIEWYATIPVARLVLANDGCRTTETPLSQQAAEATVTTALNLLCKGEVSAGVCVDGPQFHPRLVLDVVASQLGCRAARRAAGWMRAVATSPSAPFAGAGEFAYA